MTWLLNIVCLFKNKRRARAKQNKNLDGMKSWALSGGSGNFNSFIFLSRI